MTSRRNIAVVSAHGQLIVTPSGSVAVAQVPRGLTLTFTSQLGQCAYVGTRKLVGLKNMLFIANNIGGIQNKLLSNTKDQNIFPADAIVEYKELEDYPDLRLTPFFDAVRTTTRHSNNSVSPNAHKSNRSNNELRLSDVIKQHVRKHGENSDIIVPVCRVITEENDKIVIRRMLKNLHEKNEQKTRNSSKRVGYHPEAAIHAQRYYNRIRSRPQEPVFNLNKNENKLLKAMIDEVNTPVGTRVTNNNRNVPMGRPVTPLNKSLNNKINGRNSRMTAKAMIRA